MRAVLKKLQVRSYFCRRQWILSFLPKAGVVVEQTTKDDDVAVEQTTGQEVESRDANSATSVDVNEFYLSYQKQA
jgi:hypothetical protein